MNDVTSESEFITASIALFGEKFSKTYFKSKKYKCIFIFIIVFLSTIFQKICLIEFKTQFLGFYWIEKQFSSKTPTKAVFKIIYKLSKQSF